MAGNQYDYGGYGYNPLDPRAQFMTGEQQGNATTDPILTKPAGASDAGNVGSVAGAMPGYAGGLLGLNSASFLGGAGGPNVAGNAQVAQPAQQPANAPMTAQDLSNYSFGSYTPPQAQGATLNQMGVDNNAAMMHGLGDYQAGSMGMPGASGQYDYESKLAALRQQSEIATAADKAQKAAAATPFDTMQSSGMYASNPLEDMRQRLQNYGSMNPAQQYYLQQQMQGLNQGQVQQLQQQFQPAQQPQQAAQPAQQNANPYLQPFQQTNAYNQSVNQNWGGGTQQQASPYQGNGQQQNPYLNQGQSQGTYQPMGQQNRYQGMQQQGQQGLLQRFQGQGQTQQQQPQGNRYGLLSAYGAR